MVTRLLQCSHLGPPGSAVRKQRALSASLRYARSPGECSTPATGKSSIFSDSEASSGAGGDGRGGAEEDDDPPS